MNMKTLYWVGSSRKDIKEMPEDIRDTFGFALFLAQQEQKHEQAKPLQGFGSAGVLEVVESSRDGTYRAVYTVRFAAAVYVLHCFQKKVHIRHCYIKAGRGTYQVSSQTGGGSCQGE